MHIVAVPAGESGMRWAAPNLLAYTVVFAVQIILEMPPFRYSVVGVGQVRHQASRLGVGIRRPRTRM
jgi:hypothetical protein